MTCNGQLRFCREIIIFLSPVTRHSPLQFRSDQRLVWTSLYLSLRVRGLPGRRHLSRGRWRLGRVEPSSVSCTQTHEDAGVISWAVLPLTLGTSRMSRSSRQRDVRGRRWLSTIFSGGWRLEAATGLTDSKTCLRWANKRWEFRFLISFNTWNEVKPDFNYSCKTLMKDASQCMAFNIYCCVQVVKR